MLDIKQTIRPLCISFQSDLERTTTKEKKRTTTKMKKSLAIIVLTILTIFSAFAGQIGNTASTKVELSLGRSASYAYGITKDAIASENDNISDIGTLTLNRKANSTELEETNAYVSYIFKEFESVKLTISVSGNMTSKTTDSEIPFTVTVASASDNVAFGSSKKTNGFTLKSNDAEKMTADIVDYDETTTIGDYRWASAELTVSGSSLVGVKTGYYTATITLTATSK